LIYVRLLWRSIKAPAYRLRWGERLGFYRCPAQAGVLWIHAVSLGEAEAVFPLVRKLQQAMPTQAILMTSTTPTGSARIQAVLGESVSHVYLPYDIDGAVRRFLRHFQPQLAVIMETELWPTLLQTCLAQQIPVAIINARLSEKSARGYAKLPCLVHPTLAAVTRVAAQTEADAQRFLQIGATPEQVLVCGNIKFDASLADAQLLDGQRLRAQQFAGRFVWLIASTHHGEEAIFLERYAEFKRIVPELLLVIAPRHPERFAEVNHLCAQLHLPTVMRTSHAACTTDTAVYLADTLGELKMLYAAADLAFVGGSLVPVGGHNVLEAAMANVPVLFGPHMHHFTAIAQGLLAAGAALQCADAAALAPALQRLYTDVAYRQHLAARAQQFVSKNQGATERVLALLQNLLRPAQ
jgi:3-deoxy-D-manno-octulosonic-acid transferase